MSRPSHVTISSGLEAWDGEVSDNFDLAFSTPFPIAIYANFAALPAAGSYDECLAVISDEDILCISNGTTWKRIGYQAADIVALTGDPGGSATDTLALSLVTARTAPSNGTAGNHANIPDPADSPASADALRDDLVANTLPAIQDSIKTLAAQLLEITDAGGLQLDTRDNLKALTTKVNLIRTNLRASGIMA